MLKKITNFFLSFSILTAIIFASLGCNQTWQSKTHDKLLSFNDNTQQIQESTCNCYISDQNTEILQTQNKVLEIESYTSLKFFIDFPKTTHVSIQHHNQTLNSPDPPPEIWIKTLARSQLQS